MHTHRFLNRAMESALWDRKRMSANVNFKLRRQNGTLPCTQMGLRRSRMFISRKSLAVGRELLTRNEAGGRTSPRCRNC